jgi:hypothetical protein
MFSKADGVFLSMLSAENLVHALVSIRPGAQRNDLIARYGCDRLIPLLHLVPLRSLELYAAALQPVKALADRAAASSETDVDEADLGIVFSSQLAAVREARSAQTALQIRLTEAAERAKSGASGAHNRNRSGTGDTQDGGLADASFASAAAGPAATKLLDTALASATAGPGALQSLQFQRAQDVTETFLTVLLAANAASPQQKADATTLSASSSAYLTANLVAHWGWYRPTVVLQRALDRRVYEADAILAELLDDPLSGLHFRLQGLGDQLLSGAGEPSSVAALALQAAQRILATAAPTMASKVLRALLAFFSLHAASLPSAIFADFLRKRLGLAVKKAAPTPGTARAPAVGEASVSNVPVITSDNVVGLKSIISSVVNLYDGKPAAHSVQATPPPETEEASADDGAKFALALGVALFEAEPPLIDEEAVSRVCGGPDSAAAVLARAARSASAIAAAGQRHLVRRALLPQDVMLRCTRAYVEHCTAGAAADDHARAKEELATQLGLAMTGLPPVTPLPLGEDELPAYTVTSYDDALLSSDDLEEYYAAREAAFPDPSVVHITADAMAAAASSRRQAVTAGGAAAAAIVSMMEPAKPRKEKGKSKQKGSMATSSTAVSGAADGVVAFSCGHAVAASELRLKWMPAIKHKLSPGFDIEGADMATLINSSSLSHPASTDSKAREAKQLLVTCRLLLMQYSTLHPDLACPECVLACLA